MFRIEYSREAIKALMRMPRNTADRIKAKIDGLAVDPYAPNNNVKRLQGSDDYRLRVGDWRVGAMTGQRAPLGTEETNDGKHHQQQ